MPTEYQEVLASEIVLEHEKLRVFMQELEESLEKDNQIVASLFAQGIKDRYQASIEKLNAIIRESSEY